MKKIIYSLSFGLALASCSSDEPGTTGGAKTSEEIPVSRNEQQAIYVQNDFSFRMLDALAADNTKNLIFSPLGVSMDMCMIAEGADDEAAREIYDVMGFDRMEVDEITAFNKRLSEKLGRLDSQTVVEMANSLWIDKSVNVREDFLTRCKERHDAEVFIDDLHTTGCMERINKWVSNKTHGNINDLLRFPLSTVETSFINALYFKGEWTQQFSKENTKPMFFNNLSGTKSMVSMMKSVTMRQCWQDDTEKAVRLTYGNRAYSITLVLPNEGVSLHESISTFNSAKVAEWEEYLKETEEVQLTLYLPKFKTESELDMGDVLRNMGINRVFTNKSLTKVADSPLDLGVLWQRSLIELDEKGTKAVSVTFTGDAAYPGPIQSDKMELKFDRPFFYWISERSTGAILFAGSVVEF